jgi:hypothetical protein
MSKIYLFHKDQPEGKAFDVEVVRAKQDKMKKDGWVDTPALLDLPKPKPKAITDEEAKQAKPQELVAMVKALGYMVLTEVEFTAEVSKAAHQLHVDAGLANTEEKDQKLSETEEKLIAQFEVDAFSLTKPELIQVGKLHNVRLTMNHNEDTMVEKIQEAMAV